MKINIPIIALTGFVSACTSSNEKSNGKADNRPNILLIVSDDHGQNDLGCYGNKSIKTPNLDHLASQGTKFNRAYTPSATSSPSRSAILSGYYPHANGMYGLNHRTHNQRTHKRFISLPVLMTQAGYETAICGKFHVSPIETYNFKHWIKGHGHNAAEMAENSKKFISSVGDKPFFLYFATQDPHRAGGVVDSIPEKPNCFGNCYNFPESPGITFSPDSVEVPYFLTDNKETRAELAQYYQSVARMDYGIGKLFDALKNAGKWENTLIIYCSDNGVAMPGAKTTLYESGINMPFIVKEPGNKNKGKTSNALINYVDIAPTILDFANSLDFAEEKLDSLSKVKVPWYDIKMQNHFQGKSFRAVLDEKSNTDFDTTFASHNFHEITMYYPVRVIITNKYKLIWNIAHQLEYPSASDLYESATWQSLINGNYDKLGHRKIEDYLHRPEFELYNIEKDPKEINNLASNPNYSETLGGLKSALKKWQKETRDPWLLKWDRE